MLQVKIYDQRDDSVVHEFNAQVSNLAMREDIVKVPVGGQKTAYYVQGRQFDYDNGEVRLVCRRQNEADTA